MCGGGNNNVAEEARRQQQETEQRINLGRKNIDQVFAQFNPAFYADQQGKYERFAMPQLQEQYKRAGDTLAYRLFGQGLQRSSVGRDLGNSLGQEYGKQTRAVGDEGLRRSQELQGNVTQQKMSLQNQLQASADPQQALQGALTASQQFQAPSPMMPIGQAFNQWVNSYLQQQQAGIYNTAADNVRRQTYNIGNTQPKTFTLVGGA